MRRVEPIWRRWLQTLYPGYFASVMATGIVSVALLLTKVDGLSAILWGIGFVVLAAFCAIYLARILRFPAAVREDLYDPSKVFGFFTFVAALGVMATRSALGGWTYVPGILTVVAAVAWFLLTYFTFGMLLFTNSRPIQQSVNGAWLIAIVATESLAITWVLLTAIQPTYRPALQLLSYAYWTFGVLLYLIFIAFIMYRFFFHTLQPSDLTPPYWINMGAMAITSVAGARLLATPHPSAFLHTLQPYIEGFTVMMWAWGTWWIPLLLLIGVWKYWVRREPIAYHPALWSIVFPLGMYATSLHLLGAIPGLSFLLFYAPIVSWIAFAAWLLVALGWLWSLVRAVRLASPRQDVEGKQWHKPS